MSHQFSGEGEVPAADWIKREYGLGEYHHG